MPGGCAIGARAGWTFTLMRLALMGAEIDLARRYLHAKGPRGGALKGCGYRLFVCLCSGHGKTFILIGRDVGQGGRR